MMYGGKMSSVLDRYGCRLYIRKRMFSKGWGGIEHLGEAYQIRNRTWRWEDEDTCKEISSVLNRSNPPKPIEITWGKKRERRNGIYIKQGRFPSPGNDLLLPEECRNAYVELILPPKEASEGSACVSLAATGEEGFLLRRRLALPLAKKGIASLILENPFYGRRRPFEQKTFSPNRFIDFFSMFSTTLEEARSLLLWLEDAGLGPLGICGISMGASIAAIVAAKTPRPLAVVSLVPSHSPAPIFTEGVLSHSVDWGVLDKELRTTQDARNVMRNYLNIHDIRSLPLPVDPGASFIISARNDAVVPAYSSSLLHEHWVGSNVEWVDTGHLAASFINRRQYQKNIVRALDYLRSKVE